MAKPKKIQAELTKTSKLFVLAFGLILIFFGSILFIIQPVPQAGANPQNSMNAQTNVTLVVVPSGDAQQTAQAIEQIAQLLEQETGYTVSAFVSSCYGAAVNALVLGEADIGWLPAATYVLAHDRFGVNVNLVAERFGATSYRSQFVVRNDSGINDLSDLAGKNFAFVHPSSASGFMYPALHISNTQSTAYDAFLGQIVFAGSHRAAIEAVYTGQDGGTLIQGGASFEDARSTVAGTYPDIFTETKIIGYTDAVPNDTVSTRPGLDATLAQQVINGLQNVAGTVEGSNALQQLAAIEGLQPTNDNAYNIVREAVSVFNLDYDNCSQTAQATNSSGGSLSYINQTGLTTTVQIPPGAVAETVQVNFSPLPIITYSPANLDEIGNAFNLTAVISGTNQVVTSLSAPYSISIVYSENELGSTAENSLALYWWDGTQWQKEPTSVVNTTENTISAAPNHFSFFAVLGNRQTFLPLIINSP